jgi:hypothetical protein
MRQACTEQVTFVVEKHLRLVDQATERGGVHDPVAVTLKRRARWRGGLRVAATT